MKNSYENRGKKSRGLLDEIAQFASEEIFEENKLYKIVKLKTKDHELAK